MKRVCLAIAMLVVLCVSAIANTQIGTFNVYEGWQLVSAPLVPLDSNPYIVFANAPSGIEFMLSGWDPTTGGTTFEGDVQTFGGILLGQGYWLNVNPGDGSATISYGGVADGVPDSTGQETDMWIPLPGNQNDHRDAGAWHMIGCPFNHPICVNKKPGGQESYAGDNISFTDGATTKTWGEAVTDTWVADAIYGFDAAMGGFNVQYDGGGLTTNLEPGRGYWINTYKDNITMIVPANP